MNEPNFLEKACTRAMKEHGVITTFSNTAIYQENAANINLYSIYQVLIENTGRFVECNAGDLLITIPHIEEAVKNIDSDKDIIYFGLRKLGVDHEDYILQRCIDAKDNYGFVNSYYRRIYAILIEKTFYDFATIKVTMLDITDSILQSDIQADAARG